MLPFLNSINIPVILLVLASRGSSAESRKSYQSVDPIHSAISLTEALLCLGSARPRAGLVQARDPEYGSLSNTSAGHGLGWLGAPGESLEAAAAGKELCPRCVARMLSGLRAKFLHTLKN